jgi:peptidylprolyl isomerase
MPSDGAASRTRWVQSLMLALLASLPAFSAAADSEPLWREVDPENLVFMELQEGQVVIELNPLFAPATVEQFRRLVRDRFYDGLGFYRVIDGFVAQAGDGSDLGELSNSYPLIDPEFEQKFSDTLPFTLAQSPDLYAPETGFIDGFAVARDPRDERVWLTHCPGVIAMARNDSPGSSRTDFYFVIGQAPRYLDRNMNVFGRVIDGMSAIQKISRGRPAENGIIQDETATSRIRSVRLAADIPENERLSAYVIDTSGEAFEDLLKERRNRKQSFFHKRPPNVLDVCQVPIPGKITK